MGVNWQERARKLKMDIPALFLALKDHDKPKKWCYGIPVVLVWLLIGWWAVKCLIL